MPIFNSAPKWLFVIALVTIIAAASRFFALDLSPPGFYIDEAAISAQVICVRQSGHDVYGNHYPLMSQVLGGGYVTPAYLYSGALWTAVFGDSIAAFRSLAAFYSVLMIAGVFFLAQVLWRSSPVSWICALCAALSPWAFIFARIAWDPPLAPAFLVWSLYFLLRGSRKPVFDGVSAGVLGALALYSYPPLRIQGLMILPLYAYLSLRTGKAGRLALASAALSAFVALLPLAKLTFSGEIQGRFNMLSIWSDSYLQQFGGFSFPLVTRLFFENIVSHLSPAYLFVSGDANLRHSTQAAGQWGWLEIFALAMLLPLALKRALTDSRDQQIVLGIVLLSYLAGIVPAALTWESNPHALRSIGAVPFLALGAGYILSRAIDRWSLTSGAVLGVAVSFAFYYGKDFFSDYPTRAAIWFDQPIVELAEQFERRSQTKQLASALKAMGNNYEDLAVFYYQLRSGDAKCE